MPESKTTSARKHDLVIVESPAKTKTIKKFLGSRYKIVGSMGHIRDLPKSKLGVDIEQGFAPHYVVSRDKQKTVTALRKAAEEADKVYLATDPDREGEAIAWHIAEALKLDNPMRIEFNEITKSAVTRALTQPRTMDMDRVNAQQARRVLDRIVGYKLSPLLWRKVRRNLSAGRVQSVAVRLICDREREIQAFVSEEYWSILAALTPDDERNRFEAKLIEAHGEKVAITNGDDAQRIVNDLTNTEYRVAQIIRSERRRRPAAPFITSTLQQEASRQLRFSARRTMMVAQQLYEGLDIGGEGSVGLITYMRTDSTRIADEAKTEAAEFIRQEYGEKFLGDGARQTRSGANVQDAHEAIRPTSVNRRPDALEPYLDKDQLRLYRIIWQRFVASQMAAAVYDTMRVDIAAGDYRLRATGQQLKFQGFLAVYEESADEDKVDDTEGENPLLPELSEQQALHLLNLKPNQHFTQPPPRYTEATLVRTLEENGIGRPSTYAPIIQTIQDRLYVESQERRLKPTELGFQVTDRLVEHFPEIMDVAFTAGVEEKLDEIEGGKLEWIGLLADFYARFSRALEAAAEGMRSVEPEKTEHPCPKCGQMMVIRSGRFGRFLACPGYPECKTTLPLNEEGDGPATPAADKPEPELTDIKCPDCGKPMVIRRARGGSFYGCSGFPKCRGTLPMEEDVLCDCPEEGCSGKVTAKRTRRGKTFYGCNRYPDCKFALWQKPTGDTCPRCGSLVVEKVSKGDIVTHQCSNKECKYSVDVVTETV